LVLDFKVKVVCESGMASVARSSYGYQLLFIFHLRRVRPRDANHIPLQLLRGICLRRHRKSNQRNRAQWSDNSIRPRLANAPAICWPTRNSVLRNVSWIPADGLRTTCEQLLPNRALNRHLRWGRRRLEPMT